MLLSTGDLDVSCRPPTLQALILFLLVTLQDRGAPGRSRFPSCIAGLEPGHFFIGHKSLFFSSMTPENLFPPAQLRPRDPLASSNEHVRSLCRFLLHRSFRDESHSGKQNASIELKKPGLPARTTLQFITTGHKSAENGGVPRY